MLRMPVSMAVLGLIFLGSFRPGLAMGQDARPAMNNPRCGHCGRPLVGMAQATDPLIRLRPFSNGNSGCRQCCPPTTGQVNVDGAPMAGAPGASGGGSSVSNAVSAGAEALSAGTGAAASSGAALRTGTSGAFAIPGISIGDASPFIGFVAARPSPPPVTPPGPPGPGGGVRPPLSPAMALVRGFKIADNQSPQPVDRAFFTYNYFDYVNSSVNARFQIPITRIRAYRAMLGFEKTFFDKEASIGVRLPINTLTADSVFPPTPTRTSMGDLGVYTKHVLWRDDETRSLISTGLAMTIPTGPRTFANAPYIRSLHNFELQPYLGYQRTWGRFFLLGFEAINVPLAVHDVTVLYNDVAIGYQLYSTDDQDAFVRGVSANFEAHVNIPLNHRDVFNSQDIVGTADVVDLTYGINFRLGEQALATFGLVTPVTGPRPFSIEALAILNIFSY